MLSDTSHPIVFHLSVSVKIITPGNETCIQMKIYFLFFLINNDHLVVNWVGYICLACMQSYVPFFKHIINSVHSLKYYKIEIFQNVCASQNYKTILYSFWWICGSLHLMNFLNYVVKLQWMPMVKESAAHHHNQLFF